MSILAIDKLKLEKFKIWEFDNKYFLYVVKTVGIFEIDEKVKNLLENSHGNLNLSKYEGDKDELINSFKRSGLIKSDEYYKPEKLKLNYDTNISAVVLLLSQACNLRCTYCYADGGEYHNKGFMSLDTAKKSIDYVFENTKEDNISIILFGGEPLLDFKLFKDCVEYGKLKAKETGKTVNFSTTTNGTLVTEEIGRFLAENKFTVTLSIDGDEKTHNENRLDVRCKGTYSTIMDKVNRYLNPRNVSARATLTNVNTSIDEIYDHLYSLKFGNIQISPSINMMNSEDYKKLALSYKKLIEKLKIEFKEKNYDYVVKSSNIYKILDRLYNGGIREKFCGAVNNMIAVDIDGNIFGCHRLVDEKNSVIGNINSGYIENKKKILIDELTESGRCEKCNDCWVQSLCGGGCPAENMSANNDFKVPHDYTCELFRENSTSILEWYVSLSDEDKTILFSKNK